jgi:hypothetical protein
MRQKGLGAHNDHVDALGDDGEGPEWSGHVRAVMAGLRPDARKTAAIRRSRAVASALGGSNGSRDDGGANGNMERAAVE